MPERNTKAIHFSGEKRRQVIADFAGARLTTNAGVLLLREVDRRIGLIDAINDCLPDPRHPVYITHEQREMLAQWIFSIARGDEDLNDQQTLRDDPALQVAAGKTGKRHRSIEFDSLADSSVGERGPSGLIRRPLPRLTSSPKIRLHWKRMKFPG